MTYKGRKIAIGSGSTNSMLNTVKKQSNASNVESKAIANVSKEDPKQKAVVSAIISVINQQFNDSDNYDKAITAKNIDTTIGQIASLLDSYKDEFASQESLEDAKKQILEALGGSSISDLMKTFFEDQIKEMFDTDAKKEDIEELKKWIAEQNGIIKQTTSEQIKNASSQAESSSSNEVKEKETSSELLFGDKEVESLKDEKEGEYQDSTVAKNFVTMQKFVGLEMKKLSVNVSKFGFTTKIFNNLKGLFKNITGKLGKMITAPFKKIGGAFKSLKNGLGKIGKGLGGLGKKVGGALASPFKKIGGFFSKFKNPVKGIKDKAAALKQKLMEKALNFLMKTVNMIWNLISPFIKIAMKFIWQVTMSVITPIAIIMAKVLMIAAAITLLAIGLYLAYKYVKSKIKSWIEYFKSGKWWKDLKAKMFAAWEWMKDFGGWLWKKFVAFGKWYLKLWLRYLKFIFVDIPVWIWEKLVQFGKWFYREYIDKYLVQPFKKYIWEPLKKFWNEKVWPVIQPFVQSLTELKNKIMDIFKGWDSSKSILENLGDIGAKIKDAIASWWETSPFKKLYDDKLKKFVDSIINLFNQIKDIFKGWDSSKSILENLGDIAGKIGEAISSWWNKDDNPFKVFYNDKIKPIIDKISEVVAPIVEKIKEVWKSLKEKLGNIEWDLFVAKIRPFGFLVGKDTAVSKAKEAITKVKGAITGVDESKLAKNQHTENWGKAHLDISNVKSASDIDNQIKYLDDRLKYLNSKQGLARDEEGIKMVNERLELLKQQKKNLAAQQVQQMAQPINDMDKMKQQENQDLRQTGQEINAGIAQKEEAQQEADAYMMNSVQEGNENTSRKLDNILEIIKDPSVLPMPIPVQQQHNSPTMMTSRARRY